MSDKGKRKLSDEEKKLWSKVAETVKPNNPKKAPQVFLHDASKSIKKDLKGVSKEVLKASQTSKNTAPPAFFDTQKDNKKSRLPPIAPLEKRMKSKISRGLQEIDGRLDLHGMTQAQAHPRLVSFLQNAQAQNWRTVLVITGKGNSSHGQSANDHYVDSYRGIGVLRQQVPIWLSDPALRPLVLSYDVADQAMGGTGALYVRIRKR